MYQLTSGSTIIRLTDNASIPADPENLDYQAYLLWLADGNTPLPAENPAPTEDEILAAQARQERDLLLRNIYDPGILMAQRAQRIASTPEQKTYAEGKVSELDAYAEALVAIPTQSGFPQTIIWPTAPTK